jgi:DNA-binding HxlR family transcriptional regulator
MQNDSERCTISTTLSVIGGKWKSVILWHLIRKTRRFSELKHLIPDITQKMLTQQLRELEKDGLINRKVFPEVPPHVEYSMTEYGRTLIPVLNAMAQWGLEHEHTVMKGGPDDDSEQT